MDSPPWAVDGHNLFFLQCLMHANLLVFVAALGELRVISDQTDETSKLHVGIAIASGISALAYCLYFLSFLLFYLFVIVTNAPAFVSWLLR